MTKNAKQITAEPQIDALTAPTEVAGTAAIPDLSPKQSAQMGRDLFARLAQASISDAVALFIRSERRRHASLADLEWLLAPALKHKQIQFAYAQPDLPADQMSSRDAAELPAAKVEPSPVAVAMVTWALVSPEVEAKLDAQRKANIPYSLAPSEWQRGTTLRVIDAIGESTALKALLEKVKQQYAASKAEAYA